MDKCWWRLGCLAGTRDDVPRIAHYSHGPSARRTQATTTKASSARSGTADDPWHVPILQGRPGGVHERFAGALRGRHPALVFLAAAIAGLLAIATVSTLLGLLVMHVLTGPLGLRSWDESVVRTLADNRSGTLTSLSSVGSEAGGAYVLPVIVGLVGIAAAVTRHWRIAAFAVVALMLESATYRLTTLFVERNRPDVTRLENLPVDASFPSGHTAASIAVYSGLVLLLTSRFAGSTFRALAWTFAVLMTTFVAASRMYRGMHHPLDVAGGVVVGIGAVLVVLFACRAAGAAARARRDGEAWA